MLGDFGVDTSDTLSFNIDSSNIQADFQKQQDDKEKEIEEFLESFAEKKIEELSEIKQKYNEKIKEVESDQSKPKPLLLQLQKALEKEKEDEITKKTLELNSFKKIEMDKIKAKYDTSGSNQGFVNVSQLINSKLMRMNRSTTQLNTFKNDNDLY